MSASLKNQSFIVLSGSKGIGKGIARVFANHGTNGATIAFFQADVSVSADVAKMATTAAEADYITGHSLVVDGGQILPESPAALA